MPFTAPLEDKVPVLIVGGGGAGLTASMLLAVQSVLANALSQILARPIDAIVGTAGER
jgi:ribulose 1,5-bisphosphate synthetase/thiazole synthase